MGSNNLLHIGVCWKSVVIQVVLNESKEMEVTAPHSDWLLRYLWEVTDYAPYSPNLKPNDFHFFELRRKCLAG
jgi:hypothetical protein